MENPIAPEENPQFLEHLKEYPAIAERYARLIADPNASESAKAEFIAEITERARLGRMFPIELVDHDPAWEQIYEREAALIRSVLSPEIATRIEHYGSTAIPGISAKPVIDILIEATSFEAAEKECIPALEKLGYAWNWYAGHLALFKGYQDGSQKFHIHMAPADHELMNGLLFRDYLRSHPQAAREYEALKQDLARKYRHDREEYTSAKTNFIRKIMEKAGADSSRRNEDGIEGIGNRE